MTAPERYILIDDTIDPAQLADAEAAALDTEQLFGRQPNTAMHTIRDHEELLADPRTSAGNLGEVSGLDPKRQKIALSLARLLETTAHGRHLEVDDAVYDRLDDDKEYQDKLSALQRPGRKDDGEVDTRRRRVALGKLQMVAIMQREVRQADHKPQDEVA